MKSVDYDEEVAELVDGIPTSKDQNGITLTEKQLERLRNEDRN